MSISVDNFHRQVLQEKKHDCQRCIASNLSRLFHLLKLYIQDTKKQLYTQAVPRERSQEVFTNTPRPSLLGPIQIQADASPPTRRGADAPRLEPHHLSFSPASI